MKLLIWACLALAAWPSAFSLYYTKKKEVLRPPGDRDLRNNSYFGYSITYDSLNKKLIISAPNENDFGEVYDCDMQNRICTPINVPEKIGNNHWQNKTYAHDYWFGATVKAGPDFVMMCAPRYTQHYGKYKHVANGKCYLYANGALKERKPINEIDRVADLPNGDNNTQNSMDSFGWCIDVAPDNSIIVGGPGMYRGRVMIYKGQETDEIPKVIKLRDNKAESNFGYAIASGNFINDSLSYAVGSTYGTSGYGEVIFYIGSSFQQKLEMENVTRERPLGSMFGAVLCAANLGSKRDDSLVRTDLLVGAPTYARKNTYNLGCVYVYLALKDGEAPELKRKIVGKGSGSMFGSAIINVGDLNGDKKHEIAIGAPFGKDGGVVYLYSGAALISDLAESDLTCLQEIKPEASYGESFGMSLTSLSDYDQNGCNALAIGSPYKDIVEILRCMAAVDVKTSVQFPDLQGRISSNKTNFEFEICLKVTYPSKPENITALLSTMVTMDHEYAKLATNPFSFDTSLHDKRPAYCKNVSFTLPIEGKYETKISYTISTKLLNDPATLLDYNSSRVLLSDRSDLKIQDSLGVADCAGVICVPDLNLRTYISFHHDDDPYIIGSSTQANYTEAMSITVLNDGDVAYEPCVRVHIEGAYVLATPTGCVHEDKNEGNRIKCEPPKPIRRNTEWTTGQISLDVLYSTNLDMDKSIIISTNLYNHCDGDVTRNYLIPTKMKADPSGIVAKGETGISAIVNMTQVDIETNGKRTQHDYTISNKGPTNWKKLQVLVTLQNEPYIKYNDTPVTLYSEPTYTACPTFQKNETSTVYLCEVASLKKNVDTPKILIPMYIVPGTLDGILVKDKNVTIVSSVKLILIDGHDKIESVTTTLTLIKVPLPIKEIIIAAVVGIGIVIIVSLILYSIGFLHRKKRQELEELKRSVKRQTILWRSTLSSQAPKAEDQTQILEEMKKEDENGDQASLVSK